LITPVQESEDQIRDLKASESVSAAFQALGMPAPPSGIADIIATHVKAETRSISIRDFKNMAPGSGSLGTSASSAVNVFLSMLTPAQREAAKAGVYPLDPAAMARFQATLNGGLGARGMGGNLPDRGGNQFAELRAKGGATGDTSTGEGSGYSWLSAANQNIAGFSQAQIASAANFLKGAGLTREEVNEDTKHMVHLSKFRKEISDFIKRKKDIERRKANGEDTSEDEAKLEEDKERARKRMTPEQRKHFDDMRGIHFRNKAEIGKDHDAARHSTTEEIVARHRNDHQIQKAAVRFQAEGTKAVQKTTSAQEVAAADDIFGESPAVKAAEAKSPEVKAAEVKATPDRSLTVAAAKPVKALTPNG
jgi:hypothetical protein